MLPFRSPRLTSSLPSHSNPPKASPRVSEFPARRSDPPLRRASVLLRSTQRASIPPISAAAETAAASQVFTASEVVRAFYDGINRRDLASVEGLIAEDCVYEDLVFATPFVGRKNYIGRFVQMILQAILEFFKTFTESISEDLQFVIDDISSEDTSAVGVTWHLDWRGRPFPFSKGCSFYRVSLVDRKRQIVYGRDCVEPAAKPGEVALVLIRGVTWILQRFPWIAEKL